MPAEPHTPALRATPLHRGEFQSAQPKSPLSRGVPDRAGCVDRALPNPSPIWKSATTLLALCASLILAPLALAAVPAASKITSPQEHFGFAIGDDKQLATWTQTEAYFKKLAAESDRLKLVEIGTTEEGRKQYMLICSSPENLRNVERYRLNAQKLARAEDLTDDEAHALAQTSKPIVWIDGGLHATETVGTHQLIQTLYLFASRNDPETLRILDNVVILFANDNPDGQEIVSSWYMRNDIAKRDQFDIPRLYNKYAGHDNNRDFVMMNMKESGNLARIFYVDWIPQIIYNHHQPGPVGSVVAGPPYRDPFNMLYDPVLVTSLDALGAAMVTRLNLENKPGYTRGNGAQYNAWRNGGLRNTTYYHNQIGLLTEMQGHPTPITIPLMPERLVPNASFPNPVPPQPWHFRQSIEYSVSLNYAVLNYAVRHGDELLYNIYRMGRNSIERGSRDHWTLYPSLIRQLEPATGSAGVKQFDAVFRDPANRDPRGFILPADQDDFPRATRLINALIKSGVVVQKAAAAFTVNGRTYPAGSWVVKTDQSNRPQVIDTFEPQDHPVEYPPGGGAPIPPYRGDGSGWTLAFQMGVKFDRVLDGFDGPFERIPYGAVQPVPPAKVEEGAAGFLISHAVNNSFVVVNRLLQAGCPVEWLRGDRTAAGPDAFYVPAGGRAAEILRQAAKDLGVAAQPAAQKPAGPALQLAAPRIALWDIYGGSMPSGWTRWLLEQYEFKGFKVAFPQEIDAGRLRDKYDVIILVDAAFASLGGVSKRELPQPKPEDIPEQYRSWLGRLTREKSVPQLKEFMEQGGTVVTLESGTDLASYLGLPVRNVLVETDAKGKEKPLPKSKFHVPGSLLTVAVDPASAVTAGLPAHVVLNFDDNPVFELAPDAAAKGVRPLAWFDSGKPLRSGWAWGTERLMGKASAFEAKIGSGRFYAFGSDITFRGQSDGTFPLLFNALLQGAAKDK